MRCSFHSLFPPSFLKQKTERKEVRKLRKQREAKKEELAVFSSLSILFPIPQEGRRREEKRENMSSFIFYLPSKE